MLLSVVEAVQKMGMAISRMLKMLFARKEMRILMVGLDAAGKTTILYKLKLGEVVTTIPTIGTIYFSSINPHFSLSNHYCILYSYNFYLCLILVDLVSTLMLKLPSQYSQISVSFANLWIIRSNKTNHLQSTSTIYGESI